MKIWPRRPNPNAVARIAASGVRVLPDTMPTPPSARLREPAPVPRSTEKTTFATRPAAPAPRVEDPCGFCDHPKEGHGTRYSTFGGSHEWRRTERTWSSPLRPNGDPR